MFLIMQIIQKCEKEYNKDKSQLDHCYQALIPEAATPVWGVFFLISFFYVCTHAEKYPDLGGFHCLFEIQFIYHIVHTFKEYGSVFFNMFTKLCNRHHDLTHPHSRQPSPPVWRGPPGTGGQWPGTGSWRLTEVPCLAQGRGIEGQVVGAKALRSLLLAVFPLTGSLSRASPFPSVSAGEVGSQGLPS